MQTITGHIPPPPSTGLWPHLPGHLTIKTTMNPNHSSFSNSLNVGDQLVSNTIYSGEWQYVKRNHFGRWVADTVPGGGTRALEWIYPASRIEEFAPFSEPAVIGADVFRIPGLAQGDDEVYFGAIYRYQSGFIWHDQSDHALFWFNGAGAGQSFFFYTSLCGGTSPGPTYAMIDELNRDGPGRSSFPESGSWSFGPCGLPTSEANATYLTTGFPRVVPGEYMCIEWHKIRPSSLPGTGEEHIYVNQGWTGSQWANQWKVLERLSRPYVSNESQWRRYELAGTDGGGERSDGLSVDISMFWGRAIVAAQ